MKKAFTTMTFMLAGYSLAGGAVTPISTPAAPAPAPAPVTTPATVTTPAPVAAPRDNGAMPAGHWAKEAVDKLTACGLIQGFPDGNFHGNENLTRYQAAMIFHRLLSEGTLAKCGLSAPDMTVIVNGMQEVRTELAAISTRVGDLEKANAEQAARITELEARIASLNTGGSVDLTALNARIDALETAVKNTPAGPVGPQGPAGPAGPQGPAGPAGAAAPVTSTTVVTEPVTTTPSTTVVIGDVAPAAPTSNLYAGVSLGAKMTDAATKYCLSGLRGNAANRTPTAYCGTAGLMVGSKSVFGPIGARVAVDYAWGRSAINADVAATYNMDLGTNLGVYAGAGLGLTASPATASTGSATDMYALGLVGVEYRATENLAAFVEGNGRYYLSNKGVGTGLAGTTDAKGFNGAVKAGVKFYF